MARLYFSPRTGAVFSQIFQVCLDHHYVTKDTQLCTAKKLSVSGNLSTAFCFALIQACKKDHYKFKTNSTAITNLQLSLYISTVILSLFDLVFSNMPSSYITCPTSYRLFVMSVNSYMIQN